MPGPIAAAGHVSRGDLFLMAERKNRMERARLDKQLRVFDRECARNEFQIERQKRTIVTKFQSVALTTGNSEKALPPSGPQDSVYESSKHGQSRLSEKRLMEWKVRERQLEKFLRQYEPRPYRNHHGFRPSSTHTSPGNAADESNGQQTDSLTRCISSAKHDRVPSAGSFRRDCHPAFRRRCMSAVNLYTRHDVTSRLTDLVEDEALVGDADEANGDVNGNCTESTARAGAASVTGHVSFPKEQGLQSTKGSPKKIHSGLRSMSAASFHDSFASLHSRKRPTTAGVTSRKRLVLADDPGKLPASGDLAKAQASEDLRLSAQEYTALLKARCDSGTQFFITKANVVMTNAVNQTCRALRTIDANGEQCGDEEEEDSQGTSASNPSNSCPADVEKSTRDETMSVSSLSTDNSEENADSVFETFSNYPSGVSVNDRLGITGIGVKDYRDTDNDVKENGTVSELQRWSEAVKTIEPGVVDDRRTGSTHLAVSNCETISEALEEDSVTAVQTQLALPVSKPLKKLTIVEETNHAEPVTDSVTRTTYPAHKLRPSTAAGFRSNDTSRRHTLYVSSGSVMEESDFDIKNRRHSSVCAGTDKQSDKTRTLLQKRRKSSATSLRAPLPTGAKSNSSATSERHQQVGVDKPRPRAVTLPNKRCETPDSVPPKSPLSLKNFSSETQSAPPLGSHPHNLHTNSHSTHQTAQRGLQKPVRDHQADKLNHHPSDTLGNTGDAESGSSERPASSQWRRELAREKPPGLSPSVSSLGTVIKAAMVFSKAARQRALSSMVEEHNVDTREVIRQERLRVLQSRASVLNKIMSQFPVQGNR